MNIYDIVDRIDLNKLETRWDTHDFEQALDVCAVWVGSEHAQRLKSIFIFSWIDTDTRVGLEAVFLDDEFVATVSSRSRKGDSRVHFVSVEAANAVSVFLTQRSEDVLLIDDEYNVAETYTVEYSNQLWVGCQGIVHGIIATVIQTFNHLHAEEKMVVVETTVLGDIQKLVVPVKSFEIPINFGQQKL